MGRMVVSRAVLGLGALFLLMAQPACRTCDPQILEERLSPTGAQTAAVYRRECGATAPFNIAVGLKAAATGESLAEVLGMRDTPYEARVNWTSADALQIIVECPFSDAESCAPAKGRSWAIEKSRKWKNVSVSFDFGPKMRSWAPAEVLDAFKN